MKVESITALPHFASQMYTRGKKKQGKDFIIIQSITMEFVLLLSTFSPTVSYR